MSGAENNRQPVRSRRVLITGLSSRWGGRLASTLEADPQLEAIVGIDTSDPRHELERTEFVRVALDQGVLRRIIRAAAIDTVIDTRLIDDPLGFSLQQVRETNVTGTANLLEACAHPDSPVRKLVFRSSVQRYGCERGDPAFFTEEMAPSHPPRTAIERDVIAAEQAVAEHAARAPQRIVTTVRFATPIGPGLRTSQLSLLGLPVVPSILGFDPRWQFIHEDDVVGVLAHAVQHELPGTYNAAADGVLALSEVASLLGKPLLPLLPPWGTITAGAQLRRLGLPVPLEVLRQLRFGRGVDSRKLKATGYDYRYTSREAVLKLRAHQRLRPLLESGARDYRYERELEEFLRWSPSVQSAARRADSAQPHEGNGPLLSAYDQLTAPELIAIISSLEPDALTALKAYEAAHRARPEVLEALDRSLSRRTA